MNENVSLPTDYQSFIHLSRYSRWEDSVNRRETWTETVDRYINFFDYHLYKNFFKGVPMPEELEEMLAKTRKAILNLEVMPSMRCLMSAGKALEKDQVAGFNCSFAAIDHPYVFDEIMYILMCGTGVGFSVEKSAVEKLPVVAKKIYPSNTVIAVEDSKIGWASAFRELLSLLWAGKEPKWDLSKIRLAGARLKTFGGRASGPEPLNDLFNFSVQLFKTAAGRKLSSAEAHDLVCKIADIVVVGGVRRSALISLSDLEDDKMRHAKAGSWWLSNPQRALANNSAIYQETPGIGQFLDEWTALYKSRSGERGLFNRQAVIQHVKKSGKRKVEIDGELIPFGTNPCSEIILRPMEKCNLSEVVIRPEDSIVDLETKVAIAAFIGTIQSTLTNFRYLRDEWRKNAEEERLLGVSLTGILDSPLFNNRTQTVIAEDLKFLKQTAVEENARWAKLLCIPTSTAVTCVKPSGTVSALVDSASGIHPRYAKYYLRTVRADKKDPLAQMMLAQGFYAEDDVMKPGSTLVFYFPMKTPEGATLRDDMTALEQLRLWLTFQRHWCEHKPSITIYVREHEWLEVGAFVYKHFDEMTGVSFLPYDNGTYRQAPYQEVDENTYNEWVAKMPQHVDWSLLPEWEKEDTTTGTQELNCSSGICSFN